MEEKNRINKFIEAVMKVARGDYSVQVVLSGKNDDLDSLAVGINMMIDDIRNDITENKKKEEVLRESEEKYRELVNTSIDGVISIDHQMRAILWNPGAEKIFQFTEEEMLGQSLIKIVPEIHRDAMKKGFFEFQKDGSGPVIGKTLEIKGLRKDGTEIPIELSISSRRIGETYIATAIVRDITERRRVEEDLTSSEERLRILFEYAPDAYYLNDLKGIFIDGNKAAEKLMGYKRQELIGKSFLKLKILSLGQIPRAAKLLAKNTLGKPTGPDKFMLNRKDGSRVTAEIRTFPVKIKDKTLVLGIARDITERKQAEKVQTSLYKISEALHSTRNLDELFHSIHEIIAELMYAKNFYIALYNSADETMSFPYFVDELEESPPPRKKGKGLTEYVIRTGKPLLAPWKVFKELEKKGEVELIGDPSVDWLGVPLKIQDETIGVLALQSYSESARYSEADKNILMFVSTQVAMAIERKRAQEQIKASLEEKEFLLKEIHHRVKNNMQVISSLLRIQASNIKEEKILEMFNVIHGRIRSMSLLYEMLYKSRDMARIDLSEYIRGLTTHLFSMYRAKGGFISLKLNVKDVYLDAQRAIPCGLIITELVSNALKHAFPNGKKGEISVEMFLDRGKKFSLVIRDTGRGFPEELDFRETKSLGMQLVTGLVDQIDGTIKLNRAKGTEFKIDF